MTARRTIGLAAVVALGALLLAAKPSGTSKEGDVAVGPQSPDDYMTLVGTFVDLGKFPEAMETIEEGERKFPSSAGFHFMRGYVLHKQRKFADAWYHYQYEAMKVGVARPLGAMAAKGSAAIVENERGPDVDEIRRVMRALSEAKDAKRQLSELQAVEQFRGARPVLTLWIAEAKARTGDAKGAIALYDKVLKQDRFFVPAYVGKAQIAAKSGNKKQQGDILAQAKKIDPEHWALK